MNIKDFLIVKDVFPLVMIFRNEDNEYFSIRNFNIDFNLERVGEHDCFKVTCEIGGDMKAGQQYIKDEIDLLTRRFQND